MIYASDKQQGRDLGWFLIDPRPYAGDPNLMLPSQEELAVIRSGTNVKLWLQNSSGRIGDDYVWVIVTAISGDAMAGTADSVPRSMLLTRGDTIRFCRYHVIEIDDVGPPPSYPQAREKLEKILAMYDHLKRPLNSVEEEIYSALIAGHLSEVAARGPYYVN